MQFGCAIVVGSIASFSAVAHLFIQLNLTIRGKVLQCVLSVALHTKCKIGKVNNVFALRCQ